MDKWKMLNPRQESVRLSTEMWLPSYFKQNKLDHSSVNPLLLFVYQSLSHVVLKDKGRCQFKVARLDLWLIENT